MNEDLLRLFTNRILKPIEHPNVWPKDLVRPQRFFLFTGRRGCGLTVDLRYLLQKHSISYFDLKFLPNHNYNASLMRDALTAKEERLVLLIRRAHLSPELLLNLKMRVKNAFFVLVISEYHPKPIDEPVWLQFEERFAMPLPSAERYIQEIHRWFDGWKQQWPHSTVDFDYNWLAERCDYATPRDIKLLARKAFRKVIDDPSLNIDQKLLESIMFKDGDLLYVCDADEAHREQAGYTPHVGFAQDEIQKPQKRLRYDEPIIQ